MILVAQSKKKDGLKEGETTDVFRVYYCIWFYILGR